VWHPAGHLKTLLIDNYDSFTYNLFQLLAEANGEEPFVVANDACDWQQLQRLRFDNVVISPGPGRPEREADFGVCADVIRHSPTPLLGVCLGHQGLCWVHGAAVVQAPEPMHGRLSAVRHTGSPLFAGIPREFRAALGRAVPSRVDLHRPRAPPARELPRPHARISFGTATNVRARTPRHDSVATATTQAGG